ncbi:MAG: insulinase family protein [Bryobacteraceae bacterium]|nr:insulinase family protein [Bryobacteraceae bacterium]
MKALPFPDASPALSVRLVFLTGSASDPAGREGAAWLAGHMLAYGGTRRRTYKQILDFLFPRGAALSCTVDKEMVCFRLDCHRDHAEEAAELLAEMLGDPGWREEDFIRLRDDALHYLEAHLRGENDEELAREALYGMVFRGHPYGHCCAGRVGSLRRMALEHVREFYTAEFAFDNAILACGGAWAEGACELLRQRLKTLPPKARNGAGAPPAPGTEATGMLFIEKPAQGVAISAGFPIEVRRGHPDYAALLTAVSALGQHRMSSGRLFQSLRQHRGLNYGTYAYIEYFPGPMFSLEPEPNHARRQQIFELWIRPVARQQAHFALRLALAELEKLAEEGLAPDEFERTRQFLARHAVLLEEARSAQLGHVIDSLFYGTGTFSGWLREQLAALSAEDVRRAVQRWLRPGAMQFAFAGEDMDELRQRILDNAPSPVSYNAPRPAWVLEEDRRVQDRPIEVPKANARLVRAEEMFE